MTSKALGLIETIGLAAAIEAADVALKTAHIKLLGYENTRGGGRITIKFVGEVGAVKAAVASGSAAALRIGQVESCLIIPRPHQEIESLISQIDRGQSSPPAPAEKPEPAGPKTLVVKKPTPVKAEKPKAAPAAVKASAPKGTTQKLKPETPKKSKQPPGPPKLETAAPVEELSPVAPPPGEPAPPPVLPESDQSQVE